MSKLEYYKKIISECSDEMEFMGIIEGFKTAAMIYCMSNKELKHEVFETNKKEVTLSGMKQFLES